MCDRAVAQAFFLGLPLPLPCRLSAAWPPVWTRAASPSLAFQTTHKPHVDREEVTELRCKTRIRTRRRCCHLGDVSLQWEGGRGQKLYSSLTNEKRQRYSFSNCSVPFWWLSGFFSFFGCYVVLNHLRSKFKAAILNIYFNVFTYCMFVDLLF